MNKKNVLNMLLGCSVLALLGWMAWYFVQTIQEADANVKAGIVGIVGVLLAGVLTNFFTKRREINARHFSEKREAYGKIIDIIFDIILSTKSGESQPDNALMNKMMGFKKELMVWGGSEVIQSWNEFEMESERVNGDPKKVLAKVESVLRAIRKDLGHDDHQLKFGSLLALLILAEDKKILLGSDN